jgi:hypothetical protein
MESYIELVCKPSAEDGVVWVIEVYYVEGYVFCSYIFWPSKETGRDIFPKASILFPPKPISDESEGCS